MTSAHTSRRSTFAVAGIRIPDRDLRSPASLPGEHSSRSAVIRIACLLSMSLGTLRMGVGSATAGDVSGARSTLPTGFVTDGSRLLPSVVVAALPDDLASAIPTPARSDRRTLSVLRAYFMLTKPRVIELLLVTTVPAMVLAAGKLPGIGLIAAVL